MAKVTLDIDAEDLEALERWLKILIHRDIMCNDRRINILSYEIAEDNDA